MPIQAVYKVPGPMHVSWAGQDIGTIVSDVRIRATTSTLPITAQYGGVTPLSFIFGSKSLLVECIGIDLESLWTAQPWSGGALMGYDLGGGPIGTLASALAQPLILTERNPANQWIANLAIPVDPNELRLSTTQEIRAPLTFLILPNDNLPLPLFQTIPSYIATLVA